MKVAKVNDKVKVHYKGKLNDGTVFDSSEGRDPLEFTIGSGQVIPGFENGVAGMKENEEKTINIPASEAYGEERTELTQEIPMEALPQDIDYKVGLKLITKTQDGQDLPVVVSEVKDNSIVIDANHPLAGKDLVFDVTMVEIGEE